MYAATAAGSASTRDAVLGDEQVAVADADLVGLEGDARAAELARDPAPVGILAVPRALDELALGHLARTEPRLVVGQGAGDLHRDDLGVAFGVADHLRGQVEADLGHGSRERGRVGAVGPRGPTARRMTVSLVDVHPSDDMRVEALRDPGPQDVGERAGARPAASVVSTASIVAMFGASIAAPLAMPPTVKPAPRTTLSLRWVSVVRIASAAAAPPAGSAVRPPTSPGTPAATASIGSR